MRAEYRGDLVRGGLAAGRQAGAGPYHRGAPGNRLGRRRGCRRCRRLYRAGRGRLLALTLTIERDKVVGYELIADPARFQQLDLAVLDK